MTHQAFDPARESENAQAARPVFVSRSKRAKAVDLPLLASDGSPLPTLRTSYVRWILALALALQIFAWWRVDGYQLADSVEFMERARALVRGEQLVDAGVIRPIGFSFILVPFFALGDWFGIRDQRALVWCVVLVQMALGLVLAWRCMRIGARLAGRTGAIATGFLVATNPVFLQYSTQPVADLAAGVCIACAIELVLERGSFRRALVAGVWLGVGFMIAYKTLLVSLILIAFFFARDRFQRNATWRGLIPGVLIAMLVQSTLDWIVYDRFGASLVNYLAANGLGIIAIVIYRVAVASGMAEGDWLYDYGVKIYDYKEALLGIEDWEGRGETAVRQIKPVFYYLIELPSFFVWPVIGLGCIAVVTLLVRRSPKAGALLLLAAGVIALTAARLPFKAVLAAAAFGIIAVAWLIGRRNPKAILLFTVFATAVVTMSLKGDKNFRLVLPLLPLIAPLLALGWAWFAHGLLARWSGTRALVGVAGAAAVLVLSITALRHINVRLFGGYWAASDWVDEHARTTYAERKRLSPVRGRDSDPEPLRVAFAYHWAVYMRHTPLVRMVKLPWQLNLWKKYATTVDKGLREKSDDFAALEDVDLFVVHLPILSGNPDLMRFVNERFEVAAAFYDQRTYEDIGPIFVLARRTGAPGARTFFQVTRGVSEAEFTRRRQIEPALDFVDIEKGDRVRLLGVEYQTVPPLDFGWITYHWRVPAAVQRDWFILDRLTSPHETNVWENNHGPAYNTLPTSQWTPDEIVSESYIVVPSYQWSKSLAPVRPVGNAYRRGDLIPTRTWMKLVELDPATLAGPGSPTIRAEMMPARIGAPTTVRTPAEVGLQEMPDGIQFAADDFVRVAGFFIPVRAPWRLADDGKPVED